jgi:hypothetical protein
MVRIMDETAEDLLELQRLLDESYSTAGEHLRSLHSPDQRSSAADVAAALTGVFLINLATVTARCEPIVAPVDGLFYRGHLWFSLPPGSQRARHLHARPQVSATYAAGDPGACLVVHGLARHVRDSDYEVGFDEYARSVYGSAAVDFAKLRYGSRVEPEFTGFVEPRRIFAQWFPKASG